MFNERVSFEQAVRYLTLNEVLELACNLHVIPVVERTLVSLPPSSQSRVPTVRAARAT